MSRNILENYFTLKTWCIKIISVLEPKFIITHFDVRFNENGELILTANSQHHLKYYIFEYSNVFDSYFAYRYKHINGEPAVKLCGEYKITTSGGAIGDRIEDGYEVVELPTPGYMTHFEDNDQEYIYYDSDEDFNNELLEQNEPEPLPEDW